MNKVIWLTGLPSSGKTTLAYELKKYITDAIILDGDEVRNSICTDLGYSGYDVMENVLRVGRIATLLYKQDFNVIVALISPHKEMRDIVRCNVGKDFCEVWVNPPFNICESRDIKGLYKKWRVGEIPHLSGVDYPLYEEPTAYELRINTAVVSIKEATDLILNRTGFYTLSQPHHAFIGEWLDFTDDHYQLMLDAYFSEPLPFLILVKNTINSQFPIAERIKKIEEFLTSKEHAFTIKVVPDIKSFNTSYSENIIDINYCIKFLKKE